MKSWLTLNNKTNTEKQPNKKNEGKPNTKQIISSRKKRRTLLSKFQFEKPKNEQKHTEKPIIMNR